MARTRTSAGQPKARLPPVSAALPIQLLRARESVMAWFRPHLQQHGLTDHHWRVLRALAEVDGLEMQELSKACEVLPQSLSRMMPRLVEQKLVARENDAEDQRRILASLTPSGRRLVEEVGEGSAKIYASLLKVVGRDRLRELQRMLDEIVVELDRARASRAGSRSHEQASAPAAAASRPPTR